MLRKGKTCVSGSCHQYNSFGDDLRDKHGKAAIVAYLEALSLERAMASAVYGLTKNTRGAFSGHSFWKPRAKEKNPGGGCFHMFPSHMETPNPAENLTPKNDAKVFFRHRLDFRESVGFAKSSENPVHAKAP